MNERNTRQVRWFRCNITLDTVIALISVLLMWVSFFIMYHTDSMAIKVLVFCILANIGLNVMLPLIWCLLYKKERIEVLGITRKNMKYSIVIGFALAYVKLHQLIPLLSGVNWTTQLIYNIFLFWEPFFIFGWLQSRFEKSFGIVGGIFLTGVSLGIYHLGSFEPQNVLIITLNGIVFAMVYHLVNNLLVIWPALWCISSSVGTLSGGLEYGIEVCIMYFIVFTIQIALILGVHKLQKNGVRKHNKVC
jgi:hypothetical protein